MKKLLLALLVLLPGLTLFAQDIRLPAAIMSAGGSNMEVSSTHISRWRLTQVHRITLPDDFLSDNERSDIATTLPDKLVRLFPNPFEDKLYIEFHLENPDNYIIRITDILGRNLLILNEGTILPEQILELNLSDFAPAFYLLQLESLDQKTYQTYSIQKL